ncbi:MAG: hypothetical protein RLZ56_1180 [Bacteroidota bacterium]|jgi:hypothetical protein
MKTIIKVLLGLQLLVIFAACNKSNPDLVVNNANGDPLKVYLTDAPIKNDTVFLDIRYVEVKLDTGMHKGDDHFGDNDVDSLNDRSNHDQFGHWDTLQFTPNIYNVAALRNGVDQLLGTGYTKGTIRKIRITIGQNNSIVDSGVSHPLYTRNNYVYANIHANHHQKDSVNQSATALYLDFDLFRSIVLVNGRYYLLPYLKPFSNENFAAVQGGVIPAESRPFITVYNSTDTSFGLTDKLGYFRIRGITEGTYSINFKGSNGYHDTTINNVVLTKGRVYTIPQKITLRK